jgi:hypothetical protein
MDAALAVRLKTGAVVVVGVAPPVMPGTAAVEPPAMNIDPIDTAANASTRTDVRPKFVLA